MLSKRFDAAVSYARVVHAHDVRKVTQVPYVAHVLGVASLVLEHGGDEDQAIAALLHDTAEDHGGQARLDDVADRFGERVAAIVAACSDSLEPEGRPKAPWWPRKVAYLVAVEHEPEDALVVTAADKVHNVRALVGDHRRHGTSLWTRFNPDAGRAGQLWYHRRLHGALARRTPQGADHRPLVDELGRAVEALFAQAAGEAGGPAAVERDWLEGLERERVLLTEPGLDVRAG